MKRLYDQMINEHFAEDDLMLFLSGPRQVGKTTSSRQSAEKLTDHVVYLNWDRVESRARILEGQDAVMRHAKLEEMSEKKPILIFDEIHKYDQWKNFIKGIFDTYHDQVRIIVTGSARLNIYKKGGDSLMGRYFPYRMHPLSLRECLNPDLSELEIRKPYPSDPPLLMHLLQFGGFPMPFLKQNSRFFARWQRLRQQQLFREDIRDAASIHDIGRLEVLAQLIIHQAAHTLTFNNLAKKIKVSVETVHRWIEILESFYFCYLIRPWSRNITRSLIKEPKIFLWDWSLIKDKGSRAENFIASHLLKAVHYWTDRGFGEYELYYLRDLEKREVDFVVTRNDVPWFLVEVKNGENSKISKNLYYFQEQTGTKHAFHVVLEKPYINKDCFLFEKPVIVPAATQVFFACLNEKKSFQNDEDLKIITQVDYPVFLNHKAMGR